jgi:hypothetical protein
MNECSTKVKRKFAFFCPKKRTIGVARGSRKGKRMKKMHLYPALAVVLGAVCCALRRRQMGADFDELNLPIPGMATHALVVLTAVCLVGFAAAMLPLKGSEKWEQALGDGALLPLRVGALLHLAAGAMLLSGYRESGVQESVLPTAMMVLPALMSPRRIVRATRVSTLLCSTRRRGLAP